MVRLRDLSLTSLAASLVLCACAQGGDRHKARGVATDRDIPVAKHGLAAGDVADATRGDALASDDAGQPMQAPPKERPRGMVTVPAGDFAMGSTAGPDEQPVHRVHVEGFEIDLTEVTTDDFRACVEAGACEPTWAGLTCNAQHPERGDHPINCVSWHQAEAYCRWAKKRLPSEEEWEYAARGKAGTKYPWGDEPPEGRVCFRRWQGKRGTCPVGSLPDGRSPFGLFDMAGNVWEWTASGFSENYKKPRRDTLRVIRGGGWGDVDPEYVSATGRGRLKPESRSDTHGFRCARSSR